MSDIKDRIDRALLRAAERLECSWQAAEIESLANAVQALVSASWQLDSAARAFGPATALGAIDTAGHSKKDPLP
jgi:hypothetical protein